MSVILAGEKEKENFFCFSCWETRQYSNNNIATSRNRNFVECALDMCHFWLLTLILLSIMFTLLPSLYLLGAQYFRQWNTPDCSQRNEDKVIEKCRTPKIKNSRKNSRHHRRRKTSVSELGHDDIAYLINETGFTEEKILLWYGDFLVCIDCERSHRLVPFFL